MTTKRKSNQIKSEWFSVGFNKVSFRQNYSFLLFLFVAIKRTNGCWLRKKMATFGKQHFFCDWLLCMPCPIMFGFPPQPSAIRCQNKHFNSIIVKKPFSHVFAPNLFVKWLIHQFFVYCFFLIFDSCLFFILLNSAKFEPGWINLIIDIL